MDIAKLAYCDTMTTMIDRLLKQLEGFPKHAFEFSVPKDKVMNSNNLGYARTWRQQCYINHQRTEHRKWLVELGKQASAKYNEHPIRHAFVVFHVSNLTEQRFDPPNFEPTEKHLMDGLVRNNVLVDDNSDVIEGTLFVPMECKDRDNYMMQIDIYDLGGKDASND